MDKIIRNVIIFAGVVLLIAGISIGIMLSSRSASSISSKFNADTIDSNNLDDNLNISNGEIQSGKVQNVKLSVSGGSYILTPSILKKDIPVRMEVDLTTVNGCARSVVISAFGVRKYVKEGDNIITFMPTKTGTINIACSMNMYKGTFTVE
jgi:hypothetical protein